MFKPTAVAVPLLTLFLAACGGSDDGSVVAKPTVGTDGQPLNVTAALGSGVDAAFKPEIIAAASTDVLTGVDVELTVNGVNKDTNAALSSEYLYTFASTCLTNSAGSVSFSTLRTLNKEGVVKTTYRNISCVGNDLVTAKIFAKGANTATDKELAKATVTISVANPKLGFGVGSEFRENKLGGDLNLVGKTETTLTLNVVNPRTDNTLVAGTDYGVQWESSCTDNANNGANKGKFSIPDGNVTNGASKTDYIGNFAACLGDNDITANLYRKGDASKTTITSIKNVVNISNGSSGPVVTPGLGTGTGSAHASGKLEFNPAFATGTKLSANGRVAIEANIVDTTNGANTLLQNRTYGLVATSGCAKQNTAEFSPKELIIAQGQITFTYQAKGCQGTDDITITLHNVNNGQIETTNKIAEATASVQIEDQKIGAVSFARADRFVIGIDGLGTENLPTQALVTFKVVDQSNNPIAQKPIEFALTNTTGGIKLASTSGVTDEKGEATAFVGSGTVHAVTSVTASVKKPDNSLIVTNSPGISISTGAPDQNSFQITADNYNPNAYTTNNTEVEVTVVAADQFQNPVPDGTTITFTAESGRVDPNCTTTTGTCKVVWRSGGVRPGNAASELGLVNEVKGGNTVKGLTTILAYAKGDAGFTDSNNNGVYDLDEPMVALSEAFRDDDNDGVLDKASGSGMPVEFFADFNNDANHNPAPNPKVYEGLLCSDAAKNASPPHCAKQIHVRDSIRIIQSEGERIPKVTLYSIAGNTLSTGPTKLPSVGATPQSGTFAVLVQDVNGNMAASGTSLSVSGDGYKIGGGSGTVDNSIGDLSETSYTFSGVSTQYYGQVFIVTYSPDGVAKSIEVTVTSGSKTQKIALAP